MAICSLIEDYGLVGFETLAVEDKESMLHLMRAVDKATGCIFVPSSSSSVPEGVVDEREKPGTIRPNAFGLFASAMGAPKGPMSDPRDVQERWVDAREEWDAWENAKWRREGIRVQQEAKKKREAGKEGGGGGDVKMSES